MIVRLSIAFLIILIAFLLRKKRKLVAALIIFSALICYGYFMYELLMHFKRVDLSNALDFLLKPVLLEGNMKYAIEVFYFVLLFSFMSMVFSCKKYLKSIIFVLGVLAFIFIGCKFITDIEMIYIFNIAFALLFIIFACFQKNYVWVIFGILSLGYVFLIQFDLVENEGFNLFMNFNYLSLTIVSGLLVSLGFVELGCDNYD